VLNGTTWQIFRLHFYPCVALAFKRKFFLGGGGLMSLLQLIIQFRVPNYGTPSVEFRLTLSYDKCCSDVYFSPNPFNMPSTDIEFSVSLMLRHVLVSNQSFCFQNKSFKTRISWRSYPRWIEWVSTLVSGYFKKSRLSKFSANRHLDVQIFRRR